MSLFSVKFLPGKENIFFFSKVLEFILLRDMLLEI